MGQYTINNIELRAEDLKFNIDNIYRALNTKIKSSPKTLDQVPEWILGIPDPPTEEPLTITPSVDRQEFSASDDTKYNPITVEPVTSAVDSNIQPENIKAGISILGVFGTLSGGTSNNFVVPNGMKFALSTFTNFPTNVDCSSVTTMDQMFYSCSSLTTIPLLDTSNVTDMNNMFSDCSSLTTIPLLDTSNVTNMGGMFSGCDQLTTIPQLNTSHAHNMMYLIGGCENLTTVEGIDFSGLSEELNELIGYKTDMSKLTRFIVNGKINVSIPGKGNIDVLTSIDYDSVKSILAAADRTDNTNAKELAFNRTIPDQNGELAALVSSCTTKGWTITGLTIQ